MRFSFALLFLLVSVPAASSIDSEVYNGFWWNQHGQTEKIYFITGYIVGLGRASMMIDGYERVHDKKLLDVVGKQPIADFLRFYNISFGQFVDGLDVFYTDYRNKRIQLDFAILYIRDQIKGVSQSELESRLAGMRQATTTDNYDPK